MNAKHSIIECQVGCPIQRSLDQSLFPAPQSLSQGITSFIASCCQGIHQTPFSRLIADPDKDRMICIIQIQISTQHPWSMSASPHEDLSHTPVSHVFDLERLFLLLIAKRRSRPLRAGPCPVRQPCVRTTSSGLSSKQDTIMAGSPLGTRPKNVSFLLSLHDVNYPIRSDIRTSPCWL